MADLLGRPVEVASLGIDLLADALGAQGVPVERVDWRPPAAPLPTLPAAAAANDEAVARLDAAQPMLVGVGTARDLLPDMTDGHCCTPARRSSGRTCPARCAARSSAPRCYEGLADDPATAERRRGRRRLRVRAVPRARRGRPDGRRGQRLDADVRGRERHPRQPRVLHVQRGARQGAALRRQRRRGARAPRWIRDVLARVFARRCAAEPDRPAAR